MRGGPSYIFRRESHPLRTDLQRIKKKLFFLSCRTFSFSQRKVTFHREFLIAGVSHHFSAKIPEEICLLPDPRGHLRATITSEGLSPNGLSRPPRPFIESSQKVAFEEKRLDQLSVRVTKARIQLIWTGQKLFLGRSVQTVSCVREDKCKAGFSDLRREEKKDKKKDRGLCVLQVNLPERLRNLGLRNIIWA